MSELSADPGQDPVSERVCTTSEAARLLGVSNTTIQIMVERGELRAWKTRGGHRRISLAAVEQLRRARGSSPDPRENRSLQVLVCEDDPALRFLYQRTLESWDLPLTLTVASDGMEALLLIERKRPDLLITDLSMKPMDGFRLLRMLRERDEFAGLAVVAVSGLDDPEIAARGGLPAGVALHRKPVSFDRLRGFVEAHALRLVAGLD